MIADIDMIKQTVVNEHNQMLPKLDFLQQFINNANLDSSRKSALLAEYYPEGIERSREDLCGTLLYRTNPANGSRKIVKTLCGSFRVCTTCHNIRLRHYTTQVDQIARDQNLDHFNCAIIDQEDISSFDYYRKKMNAEYTRIPLTNGQILIITTSDDLAEVKKFGFQSYSLESTQMTLEQTVCDIPEASRITGSLFVSQNAKKEEDEDPEANICVTASQFITDADENSLDIASAEGYVAVTEQFAVVDETNIQTVNDVFIGAVKQHLIKDGFYVQNQGYKNCKIKKEDISWPKVFRHSAQRINRKEHLETRNIYVIDGSSTEFLDDRLRNLIEIQETQ